MPEDDLKNQYWILGEEEFELMKQTDAVTEISGPNIQTSPRCFRADCVCSPNLPVTTGSLVPRVLVARGRSDPNCTAGLGVNFALPL